MEAVQLQHDQKLLPQLDETDHPENARRMLRAALSLFSRKGYKGTSVREIVQAAQVTNPMLYYYFDDKEGLFRTLINYLFDSLAQDIAETMQHDGPVEEKVEAFILGYFRACRRSPISVKFVYTVLFGPEEGTPEFDIFEARQQIVEALAAELDRATRDTKELPPDGFPKPFLVEQLVGLISNHLMQALKRAEQSDDFRTELRNHLTEETAHQLRMFFFHGARYSGD